MSVLNLFQKESKACIKICCLWLFKRKCLSRKAKKIFPYRYVICININYIKLQKRCACINDWIYRSLWLIVLICQVVTFRLITNLVFNALSSELTAFKSIDPYLFIYWHYCLISWQFQFRKSNQKVSFKGI